jgi:hypothetical protein
MASSSTRKSEGQRSRPHASKSFSRIEPTSPGSSTRSSRANTIQSVSIPERPSLEKEHVSENDKPSSRPDVFDNSSQMDKKINGTEETSHSPTEFDELPIELKALTDRLVWEASFWRTILTECQLHRIIVCEGSSNPTYDRQAIDAFPGVL